MAAENARRDGNRVPVAMAVTNDSNLFTTQLRVDPSTDRLLVSAIITSTTNPALPTTPITGQVKVAVTGTAVVFPTNTLTQGVIITANSGNAAKITLGGSGVTNTVDGTGNGDVLDPGGSVSYAGSNTNNLYLNGTAGDWISFLGS